MVNDFQSGEFLRVLWPLGSFLSEAVVSSNSGQWSWIGERCGASDCRYFEASSVKLLSTSIVRRKQEIACKVAR
jgi:hypothetical protein